MSNSEEPSTMPSLEFGKKLMDQLEQWGALRHDDHFVEANIKEYVHPLLVREHWEHGSSFGENMPEERWEQIEPAIHLASHLLDRLDISWWSKLMWSSDLEGRTKTRSKRYLADIENSEDLKGATRDMLVQMAEVVRFFP